MEEAARTWEGHQGPCPGRRGGGRHPLAAVLLVLLADEALPVLLADEAGNGAGDAAYQGPVLVEADASIVVGVQALDELVSGLSVSRVLES